MRSTALPSRLPDRVLWTPLSTSEWPTMLRAVKRWTRHGGVLRLCVFLFSIISPHLPWACTHRGRAWSMIALATHGVGWSPPWFTHNAGVSFEYIKGPEHRTGSSPLYSESLSFSNCLKKSDAMSKRRFCLPCDRATDAKS